MTQHGNITELLNSHGIKTQPAAGELIHVTGDSAYIIKSGAVNLFCTSIKEDGSYGKRIFIAHFTENDIIFPVSEFEYKNEKLLLIADAMPGTDMLRVDSDLMNIFKASNDVSHFFHKAFYTWLENISMPLAKDEIPISCKTVTMEEIDRNNGIFSFDAHTEFRPAHGIAWVLVKEGFCIICGEEENVLMAEGSIFPLSHKLWMKTLDKSIIELRPASAVFQEDTFRKYMKSFYDSFFKIFLLTNVYRTDSAKSQKELLSELEKKALDSSINKLAALCEEKYEKADTSHELLPSVCLAVLKKIGLVMNIKFKLPEKLSALHSGEEAITKVLEYSSVYYRKVSLDKDWFKIEGRSLIGFDAATGNPIGLIYSRNSGYSIYRSENNSIRKISSEDANEIKNSAYEIYPQTSSEKLKFRDILSLTLRDSKPEFAMAILISIAAGTTALAQPYLTGRIFNSIIPHAETFQLIQVMIILLTATLSYALFIACRSFIMLRIKAVSDYNLQAVILGRLLRLPASFFRRYPSGELTQRAMNADTIHELITENAANALLAIFISIPSFILMISYSAELALTGLGFILLFLTIIAFRGFLNRKNHETELRSRSELSAFVIQVITGINKIRLSVSENRVFVKWAGKFSEFAKARTANMRNNNFLIVFNSIYPALMTGIFFYLVGEHWKGILNTGEYLAFSSAFVLFMTGAMFLGAAIPSVFSLKTLYSRIKPILETVPESDENIKSHASVNGKVELRNVSYRYNPDSPLVLNNISIAVNPGEYVAVTGPSGAGKSTIIRILLGFETPESGGVYYNGQDVSIFSKRELRKQIGIVLQNDCLIPGSIFQNIAGASNISIEKALDAASLAGLADDIKKLPMGIHTIVSDTNVSGGQKQKILIARALAKKPSLIIFDEAMSAIDNETQTLITENLKMIKATLITVTHNLDNIKNADRIFVMQDGKII